MSEFDINYAVQLYADGQNISNNLWTMYVVVISAILVFVFNEHKKDIITNIILTCLFILFIVMSISPIYNIQDVLYEIVQAIYKVTECGDGDGGEEFSRVLCALRAPSANTVFYYHILLDVLVVIAIWFRTLSEFFKNKKHNKVVG